ncbi:MAG: hypothetical protein OXQ94_13755 [Gemmatimonadota bacterium]|nr:hypothetical protein [Gemmatimonadota bacterium]MDE2872740.1 hypothetical protein [Gemmatimonadota bacterium]
MSARTRQTTLSGLVLTVMLAACGDDPVDPVDALTKTEALALFKSITEGLELLPGDDMEPGPVDIAVPCPLGGQAKIVGTITVNPVADTIRQEVEAVVTPTGCKLSGDAMTFTVDGDPSMRVEMSVDVIALQTIVMGGGVEGKVKWQLEDRSGECAMDLPLDATADLSDPTNPKATGGYKGKMCGHDIELDVTLID